MWNELVFNFVGAHEIRQYFVTLLSIIFPYLSYNVYNLYYGNVSQTQFASLFIISAKDDIYLLLDNNLGMIVTNKENISNMIKFGWKTSSNSLLKIINDNNKIR